MLIEAGGKDAVIVAADADVDAAAEAVAFGAMGNAGQTCVGIERAYVSDAVYDAFVERSPGSPGNWRSARTSGRSPCRRSSR